MADFCKQCSVEMFGSDTRDLAGLMSAEKYTDEVGALALCECCGPVVVDIEGQRMPGQEFFESCKCGSHQ